MKSLTSLLIPMMGFVLWVNSAQAVERWVDSVGAGTTDGSSYANRFAGWADAMATAMAAGDILHVCGTISSAATLTWDHTGVLGNNVVLTGICTELGTKGVLDGLNTAGPVLNARFSFSTVEDLEIMNADTDCLQWASAGGGTGFNIAQRNHIHRCDNAGINNQKSNTINRYNEIHDVGGDAITHNSISMDGTAFRNKIYDYSNIGTIGDGIEVNEASTGVFLIAENDITFQNYLSTKSCIIGGMLSGTFIIRDNICRGTNLVSAIAGVNSGISIVRCGGICKIFGNRVYGFYGGITAFTAAGNSIVRLDAYANDFSDNYFAFRLAVTVGTPTFNLYNNTADRIYYGISTGQGATNTTTINAYNNIFTSIYPQVQTPVAWYGLLLQMNTIYNGDGNIFYPEGAAMFRDKACNPLLNYDTLAAYQAACPTKEIHSVATYPALMSATDRHLSSRSPARGLGLYWPDRNACYDKDKMFCFQPPDAGAYQFIGNTQRVR